MSIKLSEMLTYCKPWCHNTQHNSIQHKGTVFDIQHKDIQRNNTEHNNAVLMVNAIMLSVTFHLLLC